MSEFLESFRHEAPPRTMGSETEYTTRLALPIIHSVDRTVVMGANNHNHVILKNGGILYRDHGNVLEYATPECNNGYEVSLYEKAGERTVRLMGDEIAELGADLTSSPTREPVYKRTGYARVEAPSDYDEEETMIALKEIYSTGHHETYQTGLTEIYLAPESDNRRLLDTYLATRIVWTGAGLVGENGYLLSQKSDGIHFQGTELAVHGEKMPLRYKGQGLWEVRTGEGNMSEWAIRTKLDFTSLVFRLIEHGKFPRDLLSQRGFETANMRSTSIDPTAKLALLGDNLSAIELQRRFAVLGMQFAEKNPDTPRHEVTAAQEVLKACDDLAEYYYGERNIDAVSDRIDWAAKLHRLHTRRLKLGDISCRNLIAVMHDLRWEDTSQYSPSRIWYDRRQKSHFTEGDIVRAMKQPPRGFAAKRIATLRQHGDNVKHVDWDMVRLTDDTPIRIHPLVED